MERWRKKKKATSDRLGTHLIYCEGITISIADPPEIPINSYNYPSHEKKKKITFSDSRPLSGLSFPCEDFIISLGLLMCTWVLSVLTFTAVG